MAKKLRKKIVQRIWIFLVILAGIGMVLFLIAPGLVYTTSRGF